MTSRTAAAFRVSLSLCLALGLLICGGRATATAPTETKRPLTTESVVLALWSAREYDIWGGPVIVQTLFSNQMERIVLLIPNRPKGALEKRQGEWRKDWRIEVTFPHHEPTRPRVTLLGGLQKLPEGSPKRLLGQGVALAADFLAAKYVLDANIPATVDISQIGPAFRVIFERLPAAPDAGVIVEMDLDLTRPRFFPDR